MAPRLYVRDTGILHALLGIHDKEALLSHPAIGQSWDGFVIENLLVSCPHGMQAYYYRTSGGAEIDLVLVWPDDRRWAIEIKRSLTPRPGRGLHSACGDLHPDRAFVVYPGQETYPLSRDLVAIPLDELARIVEDGGEGADWKARRF